ncbi:MAG: hypothetical protein CL930_16690, partial [Deltaproteobacteria bacterium]|nr:hypothetical protein [Deltaproteobacteria bacterium]
SGGGGGDSGGGGGDSGGGGGSGGGGPGGGPVADAGRDIILCDTSAIDLDGSDSSGSDLSFEWTFTSIPDGSSVTDSDLIGASSTTPSFSPDVEGRYELQLTVSDDTGSDTDSITVNLNSDGSVVILHLDDGGGTDASDGSPGGNDGTVTDAEWTGGRFFGGLGFDGSSYVTIPDADSLDLADDFTIDWWMRTDDIGDSWRAILTKGTSYNYSIWTYQDELYFYGVNESGSYVFAGASASTLGDGQWHHYAATVGDGTMDVYQDGVLLASDSLSEPLLTNGDALQLGRPDYTTSTYMFEGAIDELVIREGKMSSSEILILADANTQYCTGDEDGSAPSAEVTSPGSSATSDIGYVKIEGIASDESAIQSISVNGANAAPTSENYATWVAYVPLEEGSNSLVVQAEDVAGNVNTSADSTSVTFDDICGDDTTLLLAFDEDVGGTASDWGPYGLDATESGSSRSIGQYGNALSMGGSGSVIVPHDSAIEPDGAYSLEAWMRRDGAPSDFEVIVIKGDPSSIGLALYTDLLIFGFDDEDETEWGAVTTGVTDGDWHHIVGVFDGSELSLYVDGSLAASTPTFGAQPAANTDDLSVGSYYGLGGGWNGQIDQIRMYDDALSSSEVVDLFTDGEACALGDNLALSAEATASSTLNPLFSAENTVDGDVSEEAELDYTMWLGENGAAAFVELDFGDVVGVLRVRWANTHNRSYNNRATQSYRVEASTTGTFGDDAVPIASGTGDLETDLVFHTEESAPVAARYLRFYADSHHGLGAGLNEIQVYGLE